MRGGQLHLFKTRPVERALFSSVSKNVMYTKTIFSGLFKDFHDLHIKDINRDTIQC